MSGSIYGRLFRVSSFGESHGKALGAVIDGCPAGLSLSAADIQSYLDRRKPGQSLYTTARQESDQVEILSGIFEGRTTGTPLSLLVYNKDQRSRDYGDICHIYRPGHADYTYDKKYGFRDYRGGGRSSGRETLSRVAAGAVAAKVLKELGVTIFAYTESIGPVKVDPAHFLGEERDRNPLCMPDEAMARKAGDYLKEVIRKKDSAGGVVACQVRGLPAGIGEPVFDKLSAELAKGILSIGAVKGFEIGDGFAAAGALGSYNNDSFVVKDQHILKGSNHSGGVLGGISDGSPLFFRAAFKPVPSIGLPQKTVNDRGQEQVITIGGRHDPVIVPRAVVVVECMAAIVILDQLLLNMTGRMDRIKKVFGSTL